MGIKIYGCSSIGALRAAETCDYGIMIGCGEIFKWYWEGVTDDDSEVAVLYHKTPSWDYVCDTCPLVNVRAGLLKQLELGLMDLMDIEDNFKMEKSDHYTKRSTPSYAIDQKRLDAIELLTSFRSLEYSTQNKPDITYLSTLFNAVLERERRVFYRGSVLTTQNIDSYISLHNPKPDQILYDSKNRGLVLILADLLNISVTTEEVQEEWSLFCLRNGLTDFQSFREWLATNATTQSEFAVMSMENTRIRKLQRSYASTKSWSRQTKTILDYLRTHNCLELWLEDCADTEGLIVDAENAEDVSIDLTVPLGACV